MLRPATNSERPTILPSVTPVTASLALTGLLSRQWVDGRAEISGKGPFQFRPKKSKLMVLSWPNMDAKVCRVCGRVQFAVNLDKLRSVLKEP
jgi:hypothetical protein